MDIFESCQTINDAILAKNEVQARNDLIKLLDYHSTTNIEYSPLVNHLIRQIGLYPYINPSTATWQDRYLYELFKVDIGLEKPVTLHREQSILLKKLIQGESLAISAPTSFGKSFVIDAFIKITQPKNVVIVVPTVALTDETRRRLYSKFAHEYKIITTTEVELSEKNIFIFPQERAINYVNKIDNLDILIIDEFYKASPNFDKERSPSLIRIILKLGQKAKQKYFLAPNISELKENPFTRGMEFIHLDFNTVFLEKYELYRRIRNDERAKSKALLEILTSKNAKTLIYAGTYSNIDKVSNLIIDNIETIENPLLNQFAHWLTKNYDTNWKLTNLVKKGYGIHNGQLHRSLSQIQIKLFEDPNGLNNIISTSSIIEGVNTSAEQVVLWRNRNGRARLNDFTYKNIIGRGGRMFKHFIGKIFILEEPPISTETQLQLEFPNELLGDVDEVVYEHDLTSDQIHRIISYKEEMSEIIGADFFNRLQAENAFQSSNFDLIKNIATDIYKNRSEWKGLVYLNSPNVDNWDRLLYKIIRLAPSGWDAKYSTFVAFIKILTKNWEHTIPQLLNELDEYDVSIDMFFTLERNMSYKFASLLSDVNILQKVILPRDGVDISPFIAKLSHAFLPSVVYQLEEYGLPRMISKKIHKSGLMDFENAELTIHQSIEAFNKIGKEKIMANTIGLNKFDKYILDYFYDGITIRKTSHGFE
jgi:hypothetical protein